MTSAPSRPPPAATSAPLTSEERRWLHDKFERLASEEGQLAASRTSYFAAIGTVLVTGLIVVVADLLSHPLVLLIFSFFLASLGILISAVWAVLLHRTNDAQTLWREAAFRLEERSPPVEPRLSAPVTLRSGRTVEIDLARPYSAHAERFSRTEPISWMDRVNPERLAEILPITFVGLWAGVFVLATAWYLLVG